MTINHPREGGGAFAPVCTIVAAFALLAGLTTGLQAREITVPSGAIRTIQQGVDAAKAGETIIVKPGIYSDPAVGQYWPPLVYIGPDKSGLKLKAVGAPGSVRLVGPGSYGRGIVIADAANVRVEGFDISMFDTGIIAGGSQAKGTQITGNTVRDCVFASIMVSGAIAHEIDHNTLIGGQYGIFLNGWPGAGPNTEHQIHHNRTIGSAIVGIFLWNSPGSAVSHNESNDNGQFGIYVANSPNCTVDQNQADNNELVGVAIGASPNCTVTGNQTSNNMSWGIWVGGSCGSHFEHNLAEGNGQYDLFAPNWDSDASCNTYRGNRADTAEPSLEIWDAAATNHLK